jgi:hypothetical protein
MIKSLRALFARSAPLGIVRAHVADPQPVTDVVFFMVDPGHIVRWKAEG